MTAEKKKNILWKIFGSGKSSCCNLRIEEVTNEEEQAREQQEETIEPPKDRTEKTGKSLCCG